MKPPMDFVGLLLALSGAVMRWIRRDPYRNDITRAFCRMLQQGTVLPVDQCLLVSGVGLITAGCALLFCL